MHLPASDSTRSLALRSSLARQRFSLALSDNSYSRLWDVIELREKANSGNPFAQHELGLRYLLGRDYAPDTLKAGYWIKKAADQNLLPARYNLGILQNNGWGVPWNPFEAYRHFQYAANHGMEEAQYVFGMLLTDNLTVPRNDVEAIRWIKMSADSGFSPARETLAEFNRRGIAESANAPNEPASDSSDTNAANAGGEIPFLGFPPAPEDSSSDMSGRPDAEITAGAALAEGGPDADGNAPKESGDAGTMRSILAAAEAGNPDALILLGRLAETEKGREKDEILASFYFLRAIRNNSPWAPGFLARVIRQEGFFDRLRIRAGRNDAMAQFVWAALVSLGFDRQLDDRQALQLLEASAAQKCNPAVVELGLYYYSGKWVGQDREKGKSLLRQAAKGGDREAKIRLWMIGLGEGQKSDVAALVDSLRLASSDGSILAQTMIGYCYDKGIGVGRNVPRSVEYYRKAYQRGSMAAYNALRELYDEIRPDDPEFRIPE